MSSWQRRTRFFIGVFAVLFATVVLFTIRERSEPVPVAFERIDPEAVVESTGMEIIQMLGGEQDYTVDAERQFTYEDGAVRLVGVRVKVPARGDRSEFVVKGIEAQVSSNQEVVTVAGGVRLEVTDGLTTTAEEATYDSRTRIVQMRGPVTTERGEVKAFGMGATYEGDADILRLLDQAHVTVLGGDGGEGLDIVARSATLTNEGESMRFEGGVTMTRGAQGMKADAALAHVRDEMTRLARVELFNNSRITREGGEAGSLRDMRAQHMTLEYAADGQSIERVELFNNSRITREGGEAGSLREIQAANMTLEYAADGQSIERMTLTGGAVIELTGSSGQGARRIAGESMDVGLAPDGESVTRLEVRNAVQVDLPGEGDAPAQRIRAVRLDGTGEPGVGLTDMRFQGAVEYRETRAATALAPAVDRLTQARTLDVELKPGLSGVDEAFFTGDVTFSDGRVTAEAESARHDVAQGFIELLPAGSGDQAPRIVDQRGSVTASRIEFAPETGAIVAEGAVRSVLAVAADDGGRPGESTGTDPARMPAMLDQHEPTFVTAARLEHDSESSLAVYTGDARLWQGETDIQASTIILDESQGNLMATGSVRARSVLVQLNEETGELEPVTTVGWGEEFFYDDSLHRTTYTTDARVDGHTRDLRADRIEMYLGARGDTVERVEAYDAVTVQLRGRLAAGDRFTYVEADGRYDMSGVPVRIIEQLETECRETTGRTLTFYRSVDTITVDGSAEVRTRSTQTTSGKCPELQFD